MNKKETSEIRTQLTLEKSAADRLIGCYVTETKEIVSRFELSLSLLPEDEKEKYLSIFRKVLTGGIGKNLIDVDFTSKQVSEGEEQKLLYSLHKGFTANGENTERFIAKAAANIPGDEKCLLLLMHQTYDRPAKTKENGSDNVFNFIICAVCPVKEKDPGLCYVSESRDFHTKAKEYAVTAPEFGFMYPRFDDRCSNIYGTLYYSRKASGGSAFTDALFNTPLPMPAAQQKDTFSDILRASTGDECTYDLVSSVRDHVSTLIEDYENDKFAEEPPVVTKTELCDLLRSNGVSDEHIEAFREEFEESFGKGAELAPQNLIEFKKIELKSQDITVKLPADKSEYVRIQKIDGVKYVMIRVEGEVECNGISIKIG